ncbi:3-hydroxyacyl-CoA dehydrogenase NAD-binding domain-containing protein [Thermodesulfobacteriota bacterium]
MKKKLKKAGVIGAGVMGANIAAQLANVGIETILLDIVPPETKDNHTKGVDVKSREFRNRLARKGLDRAKNANPASFYLPEMSKLITTGNIEDDMSSLKNADIIIEAVIEDLEIKRNIFKKVDAVLENGTIVTSNTSGISARGICEGMSENFQQYFAVTHFFNPPRYMKLLEIVPGPHTLPEVISVLTYNFEQIIGKRVVYAKDSPNFIANRIGVFSSLNNIRVMMELGLTIEEVDELTGPVIGFPKSGTFRTVDIVGLDTHDHVAMNVYNGAFGDEMREVFKTPELVRKMLKKGLLGEKSGQGFYKKERDSDGNRVILSLDIDKLEYSKKENVLFESLEYAKKQGELSNRLASLYYSGDKAGMFIFRTQSESLIYSANRIPEIADDIVSIDNALKWGFGREMGPFEVWDAVGVRKSVDSMKTAGYEIPAWVLRMLEKGFEYFYKKEKGVEYYYDIKFEDYREVIIPDGIIYLPSLKEREKTVSSNKEASLIDLDDGVACLEFHSKMNVIGEDIINMIDESINIVGKDFDGLVISNHAQNFSAGANIGLIIEVAQAKDWDRLDMMIKTFQNAFMRLKYLDKPVVAAPAGMTLGGGCEVCLASDRVRYAAETYMGLVETGVGLIPAGGGTKELLIRSTEHLFEVPPGGVYQKQIEMLPFIARAFETIAMAKTSTSGPEARKIGYLRETDKITVNRDLLLGDAKNTVKAMNLEGYIARRPLEEIRAPGEDILALLKLAVWTMHEQGYATEHDVTVAEKIAFVLCGGNVFADTKVNEQYLLDLEREAFLSLCGNPKTQARMQYTLMTGKPLRN